MFAVYWLEMVLHKHMKIAKENLCEVIVFNDSVLSLLLLVHLCRNTTHVIFASFSVNLVYKSAN